MAASSSSSAKALPLAQTITCHCWNKDRTRVAFCPNNTEIHIYKVAGNDPSAWEREFVLKEHDQVITGLDWAPNTNRIVSCSQDRNAYVWEFAGAAWKPKLVLLRINRAATSCKWSPSEKKFAVSTGTKQVCVCHFEEENNWWLSKMIKKHKSTVLSVAWHPSDDTLLATSSSDFKCRIFSAFVRGVDRPAAGSTPVPFGECMLEFGSKGWVHNVAWSPSGKWLGFVGHDSCLNVVEVATGRQQTLPCKELPFTTLVFLSDNAIAAAGHECTISVFSCSADGTWENKGKWEADGAGKSAAGSGSGESFRASFNRFASAVNIGATSADDLELPTQHQNTITGMQVMAAAGGKVSKLSTSGLDGRIVVWETSSLERAMAGLRL